MKELPARQVHLDFHTSEHIPDVAVEFDPEEFADTVKEAAVNSMTVFARCHHGWLYYPSERFPELVHPNLKNRNLLLEQIDALHAKGIKAPVYTTVQWDYQSAITHPEWLIRRADGSHLGDPFTEPGFYHSLCVNTGYFDFLTAHTEELLQMLGDKLDGLFFDIVQVNPCLCASCRKEMKEKGLDITDEAAVLAFAAQTMNHFKDKMTRLVHSYHPEVTIFYNSSHVGPSIKESEEAYTHFEIESLPSGFWGYLNFPITARYIRNYGKDCLGMTGKFHTEWGDFHSLKNQAALEYECFRSLSYGFANSVGDQLEPYGKLNPAAYRLIGNVYRQYERYEPWARPSKPLVEAALITSEKKIGSSGIPESVMGAVQMLEELALQFDIIDTDMELERYQLIILPDDLQVSGEFQNRLDNYVRKGGSIIACAKGGLSKEGAFPDSFGIEYVEPQKIYPDFVIPEGELAKGLEEGNEYVIYMQGEKITLSGAVSIMEARAPYFKREKDKFCSHRYTPSGKGETYPSVTRKGNVIYFTHPIFEQYRMNAPYWCKRLIGNAVNLLLGYTFIKHNGPSTMTVSLLYQEDKKRICVHILSYVPVRKSATIDIIEERTKLYNIEMEWNLPYNIVSARAVSADKELVISDNRVMITEIDGYEIIELNLE